MTDNEFLKDLKARLDAQLQGVSQPTQPAADNGAHDSGVFNPDIPNLWLSYSGMGSVTKTYPANKSGTLEISTGNEGILLDIAVNGPGVSYSQKGCHLPFNDQIKGIQAGQSYAITLTSPDYFQTSVRAGMLP